MNSINTENKQTSEPLVFALSEEQRMLFMEVIEESLRLQNRSHLFNWFQRMFQGLIAHEVVIIGVKAQERASYDYEYLTSSRYFGDSQFEDVLQEQSGLVAQAFAQWNSLGVPLFFSTEHAAQTHSHYGVRPVDADSMRHSELKRFVVHGFGYEHSRIATIVLFGRLGAQDFATTAHLLELMMPHLHCAIVKVTSSKSSSMLFSSTSGKAQPLSKREVEVLEWLQSGKTNIQIGLVMEVSPLTIKNHVQNILRKLDVGNRNEAVAKALKLGLIVRKQS